jgi:hypothetical protein
MSVRAVVVACVALLVFACSSDRSVLQEGGARIPSDAGIATDVTLDRIQIDGKRSYEIAEDVESFATRSHTITALLSWEGKYVHVGVDGDDRVRWVAGIGIASGKPARVTYSGVVESFEDARNRATFEDGTVLTFDDDVDEPDADEEIVVEIDAASDKVMRVLS